MLLILFHSNSDFVGGGSYSVNGVNDGSDIQTYLCSAVKPTPPSDLEAVTLPNKTLRVSWRRPYLPAYDLQYELRYVPMHGMADLQWKVRNVFYLYHDHDHVPCNQSEVLVWTVKKP